MNPPLTGNLNEVRAALALLQPLPVIGPRFGQWVGETSGAIECVVLRKCPEAGGGPGLFVLASNHGSPATVLERVAFSLN